MVLAREDEEPEETTGVDEGNTVVTKLTQVVVASVIVGMVTDEVQGTITRVVTVVGARAGDKLEEDTGAGNGDALPNAGDATVDTAKLLRVL